MKNKRTTVGLIELVDGYSARLDPSQKAAARSAVRQLTHALAVKDLKAAHKATEDLARTFLRMSTVGTDDDE